MRLRLLAIVMGKICDCFRGCAEERAFDVAHGPAEVETNQYVQVMRGRGYDKGKFGDVLYTYPDAHIGVRLVSLAYENRAKMWVGVDDVM